jgi:hypothetical protein
MREFLDSEDWPDEHFLEEVIERILLILHTYDLDVEEVRPLFPFANDNFP